jgi:hypothetical protein
VLQNPASRNDRDGSNSQVGVRNREVWFNPESRFNSDIAACPFGADFVVKVVGWLGEDYD